MIPRATIDGKQLCLANDEKYDLCIKGHFYTQTFTSAKENMQNCIYFKNLHNTVHISIKKFVFKHSAAKMVTKIVHVEVN